MIIIDVAVHLFDLARCFMGAPEFLYTDALRVNPRISGEDVATVLMHMRDATCVVDASYETASDHDTYPQTLVTLEGTAGTITLTADYRLEVVSRGVVTQERLVIPDHGWTSEPWNAIQDSVYSIQRHWVECLDSGATPETSGRATLDLLDVTLGAYASAESGLPYQVGTLS
jgi:D-apiose dehydrogenase